MNINDLTDASKYAQFCPTCIDNVMWVWHHPLFQPFLVATVAVLLFWIFAGARIRTSARNWLDLNTILLEGNSMRLQRQRETDSAVADLVFNELREALADGRLTDVEYKYYEEKFAHLVPLRDLLPKNEPNTLLDQLKAKRGKTNVVVLPMDRKQRLAAILDAGKTTTV